MFACLEQEQAVLWLLVTWRPIRTLKTARHSALSTWKSAIGLVTWLAKMPCNWTEVSPESSWLIMQLLQNCSATPFLLSLCVCPPLLSIQEHPRMTWLVAVRLGLSDSTLRDSTRLQGLGPLIPFKHCTDIGSPPANFHRDTDWFRDIIHTFRLHLGSSRWTTWNASLSSDRNGAIQTCTAHN
ncbi:hypothetical protein FJTKL_09673 [Diaporthe vaccinii]|uniref:Uncharacterized protein n=1 Tax=Diaporthe vaccinii TaxID=105482 RepID=A0ABR4ENA3_9PEZI